MPVDLLLWIGKLGLLLLIYRFVLSVIRSLRWDLTGVPAERAEEPSHEDTSSCKGRAKLALTGCPENRIAVYNGRVRMRKAMELEIGDSLSLGRAAGNDIRLLDPFVSARHCELFCKDGHHWLRDLGSLNRTFVNGEPVAQPVLLQEGDRIVIGEVEFTYLRTEGR